MRLCSSKWRDAGANLSLVVLFVIGFWSASSAQTPTLTADLQITLDATEISRKLLRSTLTIASGGESLSVLYPKWIPGLHGPTGPIENVAGFKVMDKTGSRILWERDFADPFKFDITNSTTQYPLTVELTYICNQPTDLSWGSDCSGTSTMGVINWNPVSVYPAGSIVRNLSVAPRLVLPHGWKHASAIPVREIVGDTLVFETVTYEELIDFPIICGLYLRSIKLGATPSSDYYAHVAVDEEVLLPLIDSAFVGSGWKNLLHEAEAMFGRTHFDAYHFLMPVSDSIRHYGLEHRSSSVNSGGVKTLTGYGKTHFFLQWVLPHEFVHSWCGKYRRPAGMSTPDYQEPMNMELLWVYEGLTSYLGNVLTARSGLVKRDYYMEDIAEYWGNLRHKTGREWRSLRDIAVSTQTVWGGSDSWVFHRRTADYYSEGALLWLEVDARIRESTRGSRSLDDFCRSFFGSGDIAVHSIPYTQSDLVRELSGLAVFNWDSLFTTRVSGVSTTLDETPLEVSGYEFVFVDKKPKYLKNKETNDERHYYYESIGFAVSDEGNKILQIVPGSPGDVSGVCTGMNILGVNGKTFSFERLDKAITDAMNSGELVLLTQHGESLQDHTIRYGEGLRYISLKPIDGRKNWFDEILRPVTGSN